MSNILNLFLFENDKILSKKKKKEIFIVLYFLSSASIFLKHIILLWLTKKIFINVSLFRSN